VKNITLKSNLKNGPIVIAEILLVSVLSFLFLRKNSLWLDEVRSWRITSSWSTLWAAFRTCEGNMWLYFILLRLWRIFGDGEFAVRSLAPIFSILSVPLIIQLGKRFFNIRVGWLFWSLAGGQLCPHSIRTGSSRLFAFSFTFDCLFLTIFWPSIRTLSKN